MSWFTSRPGRVATACVLQAALIPLAVYPSLSARVLGDEYLLEVAPLDPIDPFRGAYVSLSYPGIDDVSLADDGLSGEDRPTGEVFVPLVADGDVWRPQPAQSERPDDPPYLRCDSDGWQMRCGIESLFLPQDEARAMERELASGDAVARISVNDRGNAAVVAVEHR